jgi:hypothetical protein
MSESIELKRKCPDDGTCHHGCFDNDICFRVQNCAPLSEYGEQWNTRHTEQSSRGGVVISRECAECSMAVLHGVCSADATNPRRAGKTRRMNAFIELKQALEDSRK